MGRPARIQFSGACYHVTLHGNNRQDIFLTNQDRRYFLSLLKTHKERFELLVYAYCMLPNAVHLVIETKRPNLSRVMQGFSTIYTKYFNFAHNMSGHVFQGRYKSLIIEKESYLVDVTRHVHLEPARSGMKEKPWRYPWSSAAAYVEWGEGERDGLVDSDVVLSLLAKNRLKQSVRYLQQLKDRAKDPDAQRPPTVRGLVVGSAAFAASVCGAAVETEGDSAAAARRVHRRAGALGFFRAVRAAAAALGARHRAHARSHRRNAPSERSRARADLAARGARPSIGSVF